MAVLRKHFSGKVALSKKKLEFMDVHYLLTKSWTENHVSLL